MEDVLPTGTVNPMEVAMEDVLPTGTVTLVETADHEGTETGTVATQTEVMAVIDRLEEATDTELWRQLDFDRNDSNAYNFLYETDGNSTNAIYFSNTCLIYVSLILSTV